MLEFKIDTKRFQLLTTLIYEKIGKRPCQNTISKHLGKVDGKC